MEGFGQFKRRTGYLVVGGVGFIFLLSVAVLYGWAQNISILKTVLPGRPDMKANTAMCFLLVSLSMLFVRSRPIKTFDFWATMGLSLFALIFSFLTLLEYAFQFDFGIDQLLFVDTNIHGHSPPGRFAPITAFSFMATAAAIILDVAFRKPWYRTSQSLLILVFFISFHSFLGAILGLEDVFGLGLFIPMAVHTSFSFTVLSVAFLALRARYGFMERFSAETPTALMARRMMIAVILVPPLVRGLSSLGEKIGLYSEGSANFFQAMGSMTFITIIVTATAGAFWRIEKEQEKSRKDLEESREESRRNANQLKLVMDSLPSLIAYVDRDEKYVVVNETYQKWFGRKKEDFVGRKISDFSPSSSNDVARPFIQKALEGELVNFQDRFFNVQGEEVFVDVTFIPDKDSAGRVRGFVVLSHDVTHAQRIQQELQKAKEAAEDASQAKSQFLANMSHEIRTPLGVILGFSDLAIESLEQPQELRHFLFGIRRNAESLTKLLGEILDLSKVEARKLEIEKVHFSLDLLLTEVVSLLKVQADEKGISLKLEYLTEVPDIIETDPTRLRQILMNLIGNAIKFTPRGSVEVRVQANDSDKSDHQKLQIQVLDTGIGISAQQKERLFKPFSQADSSMTRKFGGTGLGLMLSKELASALGGELKLVDSELGKGSRFEVVLDVGIRNPLSVNPVPVQNENESPVRKAFCQGLRILIVEDAIENQILVSNYLKPTGAELVVASNGMEGLTRAKAENFDIILMDVQMPVMDGLQAAQKLRAHGFQNPIIALTAHALQDERLRALEIGFNDYLTKPISKSDLLKSIETVLMKEESGSESSTPPGI